VLGWFMNHTVTLQVVRYPRDAGGGEVPTPRTVATEVPCCIQQDDGPSRADGQARRGSEANVVVFFEPSCPPEVDAVEALKVNDRIEVTAPTGRKRVVSLDGPPFDKAGRGVVWEARGREVR
jgi:hypothetical protein